jgi:hypothetical protein
MTDATIHAPQAAADRTTSDKEHEHSSWASDFASSVWGAAKVAEHVAAGFGKEVYNNPLKTAAEVAGGIAVAAVAAEAGVGIVAGAAIAGVALAGYGAVRGVQIAATEGVGAIPEHMRAAYNDASQSVSSMVDAASTIYNGEGGQKERDAAQKLENVGSAMVPVAAMIVGGTGAEVGQAAIRGGINALTDILPSLSFEPELAYAGAAGSTGGTMAAIAAPAKIGEAAAIAGTAGATISQMSADGPNWGTQQEFITGMKAKPVEVQSGIATQIKNDLKQVDEIIAKGGQRGNIRYTDDGHGMITIEVTDGSLAGRTGIYVKGADEFSFDGINGHTPDIKLK